MEALFNEDLLRNIAGEDPPCSLSGRMRVAAAVGYVDARTLVHLRETHGLPLSLSVKMAIDKGLKVSFGDLHYELTRIGKNPDTINSELNEVRFVLDE